MSAAQEAWIARPGDFISPTHVVPLLSTRVGGLPVYPQPCQQPDEEMTSCQACGKQLTLLLQAHAPLSDDQDHAAQALRFVYVFGCTAEGCGKQPVCWRSLRVTVPSSTADSSNGTTGSAEQAAQQTAQPPPAAPAAGAADDWGVGGGEGDDWGAGGGGGWGGGSERADASAAAFDFGDLDAALDAVGRSAAIAPAPPRAAVPQQPAGGGVGAAGPVYDAARPCLPAFYLYAEPESQCSGGGNGSGSGLAAAEAQHLQQLVARYEQEAGAALAGAAAAGGAGAGSAAGARMPSVEGGGESWGGEGYEADAVLASAGRKGAPVGAAFFKFSKALARCHDQCARYSFGGRPLWPTADGPPDPQPCERCGGRRVYELQLMTPLIPALAESADWLAEAGSGGGAELLQAPDSWEWLTVCVASCAASCGDGGQATAVAEQVVLVNEE